MSSPAFPIIPFLQKLNIQNKQNTHTIKKWAEDLIDISPNKAYRQQRSTRKDGQQH